MIRVLVVDANALVRRAITSVTSVPGLDDVVLVHHEAETQAEALDVLRSSSVDALIIDPVLGDPSDRRGLLVIRTAHKRGIAVLVHTSQRLEDDIQDELDDKKIAMLTKSVDPLTLNKMSARKALSTDKPLDPLRNALERLANDIRAVAGPDMPMSDVVKQAEALAAHSAIHDHHGNKTAAGESLGVDREYVKRRLADLPRDCARMEWRKLAPPPPNPRKANGG